MAFQTDKTNWRYETVPQRGLNGRRGISAARARAGRIARDQRDALLRGNRWDYDNWAAMGCTGWWL